MSVCLSDLIPVSLHMVLAECDFDCDFYLPGESGEPKIYRKRGKPFTQIDIQNLKTRRTNCLYITAGDSEHFREHVRSRVVENRKLPVQQRLEVVREAASVLIEEVWNRKSLDATARVTRDLADQMTRLVTNDDLLFQDLIDRIAVDGSASSHAINVCSFALLIASASGIRERETLVEIAQGALLHDAGKHFGGSQTRSEMAQLPREEAKKQAKKHPTLGFKQFSQHASIPWATLMAIYQHHERIDGKGFPVGAVGDEIHEAARICAVANYYEKQWVAQQKHNRVDIDRLCVGLATQANTMLDERLSSVMISIVANQHAVQV